MAGPIVIPQRRSPWEQLLPQMFLMKMQQNNRLAIEDRRLKAEEIRLKGQREYETAKTAEKRDYESSKVTTGTPYKGESGDMMHPVMVGGVRAGVMKGGKFFQEQKTAYKEGQLQDFKVGNKFVQHKYTGGEWKPTGRTAERYKPAGVNISLKQSSASEREKLATGEASLSTLDNLQTLYNNAFVGPVAGRVGKVKDIFGGNTEKQSEFNAATFAFKNQIIKEITGAQMSEPEAKRIMKQVPDVNDPPSVWKAKWKQSRRNIAVLRKKRLEVMRKSGVVTPPDEINYDFEFVPGQGLVPAGGE